MQILLPYRGGLHWTLTETRLLTLNLHTSGLNYAIAGNMARPFGRVAHKHLRSPIVDVAAGPANMYFH